MTKPLGFTQPSAWENHMANVQKQFEEFNDAIKLGEYTDSATLREKRDIILDKLRARLPEVFAAHGEDCPTFHFRDQGSYKMRTGVKPIDGDFDIDQGLYFEVAVADYSDPVVLKERVYEALEGHTKDVQLRRSCVTVFYQREGEAIYHVDIAVYSDASCNDDGKAKLAKGKRNSTADHRFWEVSQPELLEQTILDRFEGEDRGQFRRTIRYLKRWKDINFETTGNAAPRGIGLTVAAYNDFRACFTDRLAGERDDLASMKAVVDGVLGRFVDVWSSASERFVSRLRVDLPVEPYHDLFDRMTDRQMETFKGKLEALQSALAEAADDVDPVTACETLEKVLGSDFPVPAKSSTAQRVAPAIVGHSNSA